MRGFISARPSPAMAVAFVALLAALSGTAVALPGTNTVDSGDIKRGAVKGADLGRNAVTSAKVKNNSLTGSDVKNLTGADVTDDSLTGADVNEGTLAKVPSATAADSATNATRAATAGAVDGRTPFLVKLAAGQSQTIATNGAVSISVDCTTDGGNDSVRILGSTSVSGAAQGGNDSYTGGAADTLEPNTAAGDREILSYTVATGTTSVSWNIDQGWVMAPDGKTLGVDGETTALGLNYAGATCVAAGVVNAAG